MRQTFAAQYLFSFGDLHFENFLSKNKSVGRYIGTSLCMSQNQQNHSLVIHDKVEDLFTMVT